MPEWSTYTLGDFLMFSPQAYWRLVERYQAAWWPAQIVGVGASLAIGPLLLRPAAGAHAVALALVGVGWLWTAWAFWWQQYAQIFIAAPWIGVAAGAQGLALLGLAAVHFRLDTAPLRAETAADRLRRRAGGVLCAVGAAYPLAAPLTGQSWLRAEVPGFMPDPTAWLTLGVLMAASGPRMWVRAVLAMVPLAMLVLGALTRVLVAG